MDKLAKPKRKQRNKKKRSKQRSIPNDAVDVIASSEQSAMEVDGMIEPATSDHSHGMTMLFVYR